MRSIELPNVPLSTYTRGQALRAELAQAVSYVERNPAALADLQTLVDAAAAALTALEP